MKLPVLTTILLACAAAAAQAQSGLRISLSSDSAQLAASDDVTVDVRITNTSADAVSVPRRNLPATRATAGVFTITRDGQPVTYTGMLVKYRALTAADYVTIGAGASLDFKVELSSLYDLQAAGVYTIRYDVAGVPALRGGRAVTTNAATDRAATLAQPESLDLASNAIALTINGDAVAEARRATSELTASASRDLVTPQFSSSISFIGCSSSRQTQIRTALSSAEGYANNSKNYLNAGTRGARYTTWFGTYNSSRYTTVKNHFTKISDALTNKPMRFDCSTCPTTDIPDAFAYVYPNDHYRIYLCGSFWAAANTGTDSRAGTIIHETSHFDIVAGTDDNAYGQSACKSLARSNPGRAVANADSHEYFSENTPSQN